MATDARRMKIALYSDLNLECLAEPWQPPILDADIVILAGDIAGGGNQAFYLVGTQDIR